MKMSLWWALQKKTYSSKKNKMVKPYTCFQSQRHGTSQRQREATAGRAAFSQQQWSCIGVVINFCFGYLLSCTYFWFMSLSHCLSSAFSPILLRYHDLEEHLLLLLIFLSLYLVYEIIEHLYSWLRYLWPWMKVRVNIFNTWCITMSDDDFNSFRGIHRQTDRQTLASSIDLKLVQSRKLVPMTHLAENAL